MRVTGHVENGKIVLDQPVPLTEGMKVRVELPASSGTTDAEATVDASIPTLYERMKPLFGMIKDGPEDFARNHDHYIHGTPKK